MNESNNMDTPIDIEHLRQISEGDVVFELELLQVFIEDAQSHFAAAKSAVAAGDPLKLEREAHHIKGASGNVGASLMHSLANELEQQAQQQSLDGADAKLAKLEQLLEQVRVFMAGYSD